MTVAAIILAAGRGTRAGGGLPKQWRTLAGQSVTERAVRAFSDHPNVDRLVLVVHADDQVPDHLAEFQIAIGGATRQASVLAGLCAVEGTVDQVLIHDAARPIVRPDLIDRVLDGLRDCAGAAPALALRDALWTGQAGRVTDTIPRDGLYRAQTPQGFRLEAILAAHRAFQGDAADDVEVALSAGLDVAIVEGDEDNLKITAAADFDRAARILGAPMDIRTGTGFDVHRFGPGNRVRLCGVDVPFDRGLQGHSDADVGMHAVTDAIFGALAEGDIGRQFPPSDPQWKGTDSAVFLAHARDLAADRGFAIGNVDCTLICEAPKIGPHAPAMQDRLARILEIDRDRVSVKATTSEKLGFTGRGEGIAAQAVATLVRR